MKRYAFDGRYAAVAAALLVGVAGTVCAGNPPEGKTVLWDKATKSLRISFEDTNGYLGTDFWITNRVYDAATLDAIEPATMATKTVESFVVDVTNGYLRAWFNSTDAAAFEATAPVFDIVHGTLEVAATGHESYWNYSVNHLRPKTVFHVRENATMKFRNEIDKGTQATCYYLYLNSGALVLHGGQVVQPFLTTVANSPTFENRDSAQNANALHIMGIIQAKANAKSSVISARRVTLDTYNGAQPCIFDVEEGAVLELDAEIIDNTRGGKASPSGFVKRGKGRLQG